VQHDLPARRVSCLDALAHLCGGGGVAMETVSYQSQIYVTQAAGRSQGTWREDTSRYAAGVAVKKCKAAN